MDGKEQAVDSDKEVLSTAFMAVKMIREGAKSSGREEITILRIITKLIYSCYDVVEINKS